MRTPEDLTGKDGEIVLVEFCEEHPPLISQVHAFLCLPNWFYSFKNITIYLHRILLFQVFLKILFNHVSVSSSLI